MWLTGESLAQAGDLMRPNWHSAVLISITSSYSYTTKFSLVEKRSLETKLFLEQANIKQLCGREGGGNFCFAQDWLTLMMLSYWQTSKASYCTDRFVPMKG